MAFVDAHNHLHDARLAPFRPAIVAECVQLGIAKSVVNGTSPRDWPDVAEFAARYDWIVPSFGVHPWYLDDLPPNWFEILSEKVRDSDSVVIGEIGIDHWKDGLDRALQEEIFTKQLGLAIDLNRPVTIHGLKAWGRLLELLRTHGVPKAGFLLHSYSGPRELVAPFAELGGYFSCAPAFLSPSRGKKLETFKAVPIDRLLPETDAPDQGPPATLDSYQLRGPQGDSLNHPGNIASVYRALANLLGRNEDELSAQLSSNFYRLFK